MWSEIFIKIRQKYFAYRNLTLLTENSYYLRLQGDKFFVFQIFQLCYMLRQRLHMLLVIHPIRQNNEQQSRWIDCEWLNHHRIDRILRIPCKRAWQCVGFLREQMDVLKYCFKIETLKETLAQGALRTVYSKVSYLEISRDHHMTIAMMTL